MSVVTKNPFAYLGNDSDGEEKPVVPVKTVDKNTARTTKRNVEPQAPVRAGGAGVNRRGPGGNEGAFRDRGAGSNRNQNRSTEEAPRDATSLLSPASAATRLPKPKPARLAQESAPKKIPCLHPLTA
ncbi:RAY38 protein [Fusarium fujikuroi]|nr:RAY38 protein [Fusarium fujikuroi]